MGLVDTPLPPPGLRYPLSGTAPLAGELIEIQPGIHWARMHVPGALRHVNCWLLDDAEAADGSRTVTVVDTGMNLRRTREEWTEIEEGALRGAAVSRVIGTHFHPDHIGLAGWLCVRHQAPLVMTRVEWLMARMLIADAQDTVPDEMIAFWKAAGWSEQQITYASADGWSAFRRIVSRLPMGHVRIADGDTLDIGGSSWQVVTGSGHSPEHACLLDQQRGLLISGDQVLPRISSNISLSVMEPLADPLGDWLASIDKLRLLPADLLVLPGHGDPFFGLHARLDALAEEHHSRLEKLHTHLAEPQRVVDCLDLLFEREIGPEVFGAATSEGLAHLRWLEVRGRALREERDGVWWWSAA